MKRTTLIIIAMLFGNLLLSQSIDVLRSNADRTIENGQIDSAIYFYTKILDAAPDDYDARLAIARLYLKKEDYQKAGSYFKSIYKKDKNDVKALYGLAEVKLYSDNINAAIKYYNKALKLKPDMIPLHFGLAKAYSWNGQLNKAIERYNVIMELDPTYSEAWQGIGKMYYWMDKPHKALKYYSKALELDPENEEIIREYRDIKRELKWRISSKFKILNEDEEFYKIDALIQKYSLAKRLSDHLDMSVSFALDNSDRDFKDTESGDTSRTYDNAAIMLSWISQNNKITGFASYSNSDEKLSGYGLKWKWTHDAASVRFENTATAAYDYFYYWNEIGQKYISDKMKIISGKLSLGIEATYGIIDSTDVEDVANDKYFIDFNPHYDYGVSLSYKLSSKPLINIGAGYSYSTYKYKSRYYYSPLGRKLFGPSLTMYYPIGKFYIYSGVNVNLGTEYYYELEEGEAVKHYIDANNWSADLEVGYEFRAFDVSLSASRFYNDFYSNYHVALALRYLL